MQAGANPFSVSSSGDWTVNLTQPLIEKVTSYWVQLVREGVIPQYQDYTPPWEHAITAGTFDSYLGASWEPGYGIAPYVKAGTQSFIVQDMPQWSASGTPIDANWGGSGYVVSRQSKAPEAGALLAAFMDLGTVQIAMSHGGSPPLVNNVSSYSGFKTGGKVPDFTQPNLNVVFNNLQKYVSPDFTFSPWTTELSADLEVQLAAAFGGKESAAQALAKTQSEIVSFGKAQGYTVTAG
jgi:multiple sugar transport system substrate-binding protein